MFRRSTAIQPHVLRGSLVRAAATCAVGFGVMNLFYVCLAAEYRSLRGPYSYLSSSVGDALCLPIIVGSLHFARASLPAADGGHVAGALGALAGLVSGANQLAWLRDPNPDLNWTLVAPHTFNAAGWYHAVFSVWLAGYCGYQIGDLISRARRHGVSRSAKGATLVGLAAACLFAGLLIIDNVPSLDRAASRSSMFAIAGAGLSMIVLAAFVATRGAVPESGNPS